MGSKINIQEDQMALNIPLETLPIITIAHLRVIFSNKFPNKMSYSRFADDISKKYVKFSL